MFLAEIYKSIRENINSNNSNYIYEYLSRAPEIQKYLNSFNGIKTDLEINSIDEYLDYIKVLIIFSDIVTIFTGMDKQGTILIEKKDNIITVPKWLYEEFRDLDRIAISAGYVCMNEDELNKLINEVEPLLLSGRTIIRPIPIIMKSEKKPNGKPRTWRTFYVDPNTPAGEWFITGETGKQNSIPFKINNEKPVYEKEIFNISMPFIDGLDIKTLNKVLSDEQDHLSSLRQALKGTINEIAENDKYTQEIQNDIIRPEIDKINARFKSLTAMYSLRIAGAIVSTAVISLLALTSTGWAQSVTGLFGANGLGLITREVTEYMKAKEQLKENPYYLFWRLKKRLKS